MTEPRGHNGGFGKGAMLGQVRSRGELMGIVVALNGNLVQINRQV